MLQKDLITELILQVVELMLLALMIKLIFKQLEVILAQVFIDENGNSIPPEVKQFGGSNQIKVTTKYMIDDDSENVDEIVEDKLDERIDHDWR